MPVIFTDEIPEGIPYFQRYAFDPLLGGEEKKSHRNLGTSALAWKIMGKSMTLRQLVELALHNVESKLRSNISK